MEKKYKNTPKESNNITGRLSWFTESEFVDTETGEMITSDQIKRKEYRIISKTKKTTINETTGLIKITNVCRRTGQLKLW